MCIRRLSGPPIPTTREHCLLYIIHFFYEPSNYYRLSKPSITNKSSPKNLQSPTQINHHASRWMWLRHVLLHQLQQRLRMLRTYISHAQSTFPKPRLAPSIST